MLVYETVRNDDVKILDSKTSELVHKNRQRETGTTRYIHTKKVQ